jgi:hypothetical protein
LVAILVEDSQRNADEDGRHSLEVRFRIHASTRDAQRSRVTTQLHELLCDRDIAPF